MLIVPGSRKIEVFMISRFVAFRCHGNIDFCKIIIIIINFSLNQVSGENFDELKSRLKILGMVLEKLYRHTIMSLAGCSLWAPKMICFHNVLNCHCVLYLIKEKP